MKIRTHHFAASLFAVAIFLGTAAWFGVQAPVALASCPSGTSVTLYYPSTSSSTTITGTQTLQAYIPTVSTTSPSGMTFSIVSPTNVVLGQGVLKGSYWSLDWDSRNVPNGTYQMVAVAHYGTNTTSDCPSGMVPFSVNNAPTQTPTLTASVNPNSWQGAPGQSGSFAVNAIYVDQFGRQMPLPSGSSISWVTNAGSLSNTNQPTTILAAGPVTGTFSLGVSVTYNGLGAHSSAAIKVVAPTTTSGSSGTLASPSPTPSPTPIATSTDDSTGTSDLSSAEIQLLTTTPTIFRPFAPTNSDPVVPVKVLGCVEQKIGQARFKQVSSGLAQTTSEERRKAANCFSGADRIPATLAPVEPAHITELTPETNIVTVAGLRNETITNSKGSKVKAILINGTGTPSSSVFIYIFSDPMVLRAQTDDQGKWSYVLQNPLKPGQHEVYAVAEKDSSTFVRTPAVPVSIAAASPGSQDGSLVIESKWAPAQIGFAAAAVALVIVAIFLLLRLRRRHRLIAPGAATPASGALIQPTAPAPPAPEPPANETKV